MTATTPMTTPISVRALRSLCAHRLEVEMATASEKFIVLRNRKAAAGSCESPGVWGGLVGFSMGFGGDTNAPHPSIRTAEHRNYPGALEGFLGKAGLGSNKGA